MKYPLLVAALLFSLSLAAQSLQAADISIGLGADVTAIDPHFHNLTPNNNVANHVFEALVGRDARGHLAAVGRVGPYRGP